MGPGQAQVDWGEASVIVDDQVVTGQMFVMTLPHSDGRFVAAYPRATLEFFLEGHRRAFEFFGGVPRRIVYDNLKSAVTKVLGGRARALNETFEAFVQRHLYAAAFCNVGAGHEKGHVENGVGWARRNLFVPTPRTPRMGLRAGLIERALCHR